MDLFVGLRYNSFARLKSYFGVKDAKEWLEFWESLSPKEQRELREVNLYE